MLVLSPEVISFSKELVIENDNRRDELIEEAYSLAIQIEEGKEELTSVHDLIVKAIEDYENRNFKLPSLSTPEEKMMFLMEKYGDNQTAMTDVASRTVINEICKGKRILTRTHIERLCIKYGVTADYFI